MAKSDKKAAKKEVKLAAVKVAAPVDKKASKKEKNGKPLVPAAKEVAVKPSKTVRSPCIYG